MSETRPVLCGKCRVPIKACIERDGDTWGACLACGREDRMDDIVRETTEYHLDKMIRRTFFGLSGGGVTVKSPLQREYRWITGD